MNGDREYTRSWIERAGGLPSCNTFKICFAGDHYVDTGYFDRPCSFEIQSEKKELCGGKWGVH